MNIRFSASIALWAVMFFSSNVIAKNIAIYRWVDDNNVVHFSQHQPQDENYSQLTTVESYKTTEKTPVKPKASSPSINDQIASYEKKQEEINAKNKEIADNNCTAAQLNIKMLNSFDQVMTTDSEGKNRRLTSKEKEEQLKLSKKHVELYCRKE